MKITKKDLTTVGNENYTATIIKVNSLRELANSDNLAALDMFGFTAIVNKHTTNIGDVGIFFVAETELSQDFTSDNNLFRHSELNKDKTQKGFMEDSRRVKAIKLRGNISNALFCPLSYIGECDDIESIVNTQFDTVAGITISKKYEIFVKEKGNSSQPKSSTKFSSIYMPEHYTTAQLFKVDRNINPDADLIVTQKLHGTSIRVAHTFIDRKLTWVEKLLTKFGVKIQTMEYGYVYGSRKVIKGVESDNPDLTVNDKQHYYESDVWSKEGAKIVGSLPKGFIVYGELIGKMDGGKEIQKDYSYGFDEPKLFVYRVAFVNQNGFITDLSWNQVKLFCSERGLSCVPEFEICKISEFDWGKYKDKVYFGLIPNAISLGNVSKDIVDEGVVLRDESLYTPQFYKAKSPLFFEHETAMLDTGVVDSESGN